MFLVPATKEMFSYTDTGKVLKSITSNNAGRIRFQGTDWPAQFYRPNLKVTVDPDATVQVLGREGIVLLVAPMEG
ncbi:MAG: hypothetical protein F6K19_02310 [Cyanothece sp. SIO1E1]|nr:hypothetical protein [Cyanothece sp. SIO1E1]